MAALLAFSALPAGAADVDCRDTAEAKRSFTDIIANAETIILATAKEASPAENATSDVMEFSFKVKKHLKGRQRRKLTIEARLGTEGNDGLRGDLDGHERMSFWDRMETRLVHVSSCNQNLTFQLGSTYLLIDPGRRFEPMSVAYEVIEDEAADLWLRSVKQMIANPGTAARTMTIDEYFKAQQSVAFVYLPYCNEKLRDEAFRVAEVSEPLWGSAVNADGIDPKVYRKALEGCDGFTVHLAIFYQPDQSRPSDAALGSTVYPGQRYIPVENEAIRISDIETQVKIIGPETISLADLVAALKGT